MEERELELYGERPAVLVTDPTTAGQYDTVYVDLNDDFSFADEKPVTKSSPVSYRDLNGLKAWKMSRTRSPFCQLRSLRTRSSEARSEASISSE